jgi:hypothetical protein
MEAIDQAANCAIHLVHYNLIANLEIRVRRLLATRSRSQTCAIDISSQSGGLYMAGQLGVEDGLEDVNRAANRLWKS